MCATCSTQQILHLTTEELVWAWGRGHRAHVLVEFLAPASCQGTPSQAAKMGPGTWVPATHKADPALSCGHISVSSFPPSSPFLFQIKQKASKINVPLFGLFCFVRSSSGQVMHLTAHEAHQASSFPSFQGFSISRAGASSLISAYQHFPRAGNNKSR